jgi:hypothetical protein
MEEKDGLETQEQRRRVDRFLRAARRRRSSNPEGEHAGRESGDANGHRYAAFPVRAGSYLSRVASRPGVTDEALLHS